MANEKTTRAAVVKLCESFIARSIAQGLKGAARDRAAVEFVVGAAAIADCIEDKPLYSQLSFLALMVCTRGFEELERRVAENTLTTVEGA